MEYNSMLMLTTHCNLFFNKSRWMDRVVSVLVKEFGNKYDKEIRCIVTNTSRALKLGCIGLHVTRNKNNYNGNLQGLSYKRMIDLQNALEDEGYVDLYVGGVVEYNSRGQPVEMRKTLFMFREKFKQLWKGVDVSKADVFAGFDTVQIRDRKDKVLKQTRGRTGVKELRNFMTNYNEIVNDSYISVNGVAIPSIMYKRVFLDNLENGGRFYNEGCFQQLDSSERATIRIDGEPVVELDYGSLHASIAYELQGHKMEEGFKPYMLEDPTLVEVDWGVVDEFRKATGKTNYDPLRNIYKVALLCAINCDGVQRASAAVCDMFLKERERVVKGNLTPKQYSKLKFVGLTGKTRYADMCRALAEHNYVISDWLYSDSGVRFQALDSRMAEKVIEQFMSMDEVALPWHDSFIVKASLEDKLYKAMESAYTEVLGSGMNCKIERK